ncbi:S1C family serine protease [Fimbriiglobus ruber]|uniref:Periplasmic serine proteinase n=1 Tax=Fimbriiglobus ruber TaxID=1908690 RepID=A0A225DAP8_9BACT|nr:S1C family serine protease [Fimbriiglobus ruber]OWK35618.1 periplasmic serine proteinase [Fimbriiglobus ruber]
MADETSATAQPDSHKHIESKTKTIELNPNPLASGKSGKISPWLIAIASFVGVFGVAYGVLLVRSKTGTEIDPPSAPTTADLGRQLLQGVGTTPDRVAQQGDGKQFPSPFAADKLFALSSPSVVQILIQNRHNHTIGTGSGFLISSTGLIATNYHVVENAHTAQVVFADKTKLPVLGVAAFEPETDIAIVKVSGQNGAQPLELAANELPVIGGKVYAIGNPLGFANTLSDGLISGHREINKVTVIQTSAPISPGSSGGPLIGCDGKVVGVTSGGIKGGQNLNYAIPVSNVTRLLSMSSRDSRLKYFPLVNAPDDTAPERRDLSPAQSNGVEFTKDNPSTLISATSADFKVSGIKLGLSHDEVWEILRNSNSMVGVKDTSNPSRIYVRRRLPNDEMGQTILYLIWQPGEHSLSKITIFQEFKSALSVNIKRLLTFEAVDDSAPFRRAFIGYPDRSKTTLSVPEIDLKHVTYFYDEIGMEITHKHSSNGDQIAFAIVRSKR